MKALALLLALLAPLAAAQPASAPIAAPAPAASTAVFSVDARLPPVTTGRPYPPLPLLRSGAEAYRFEASGELAASGLALGPGAVLQGRAGAPGTYRFTLTVREREGGAVVALLPFVLQVRAPAAPRAASAPLPVAPAPVVEPEAALDDPVTASFWRLDAGALAPRFTDENLVGSRLQRCQAEAPDQEALDACPAQAQAALEAAQAALKPLLDRRYPTAWMFEAALAQVPAGDALPAELRAALPALARQRRDPAAAQPLRWSGDGCGCVPPVGESRSYALMPFWESDGNPRRVDFGVFERIGVQGLYLQTDGSVLPHAHWDDRSRDGPRAAQRHGTKLDLVLYRQDWDTMIAQSEARLRQVAALAARNAVQQLEASRFDGWADELLHALLAAWRPPSHLYEGLTLWLDYRPEAAPGQPATLRDRRFQRFAEALMDALVVQMRALPRPLMLHVVVPGDGLSRADGPWALGPLLHRIAQEGQDRLVPVRLLVLLQAPVDQTDWRLRETVFRSTEIQRHAAESETVPDLLVQSLIPVTLLPPAGELPADPHAKASRLFQKQLADHDWQYAGVALWPLPGGSTPEELAPTERLRHALRGVKAWEQSQSSVSQWICPWICPHRTGLRLAFQALVLLALGALVLRAADCRVAALGWPYLGGIALVATAAALVGFALLSCDPDLHALSESNALLAALVAVLLGWALWAAFRTRVPEP